VPKIEFAKRDFYDVWLPNLSPSVELVAFAQRSKDERSWTAFKRKFRAEMNQREAARLLDLLAALSHIKRTFPSAAIARMKIAVTVPFSENCS